MKETSTIDALKIFLNGFMRLHLVIFIIITVGGLIFAVQTLNNIMEVKPNSSSTSISSNNSSNTNSNYKTIFDQTIVNKMSNFERSSSNSSYNVLPSGRTNPFSE